MPNVATWFRNNRYFAFAGLAFVIIIAGGLTVYAYHKSHSKVSFGAGNQTINVPAPDYANGCGGPCNTTAQNPVSTTSPASIAPQKSAQATTTPQQPDNSSQCTSIAAQEKTALDSLNNQIVQQLQIMKTIIGNNSIDNQILSRGGDVNQIVSQSQITESFNQASDSANALINQYSTTKESYQNQMLALLNSSSPGCSAILKSQLGE